jgi:hypothetical protein
MPNIDPPKLENLRRSLVMQSPTKPANLDVATALALIDAVERLRQENRG